MFVRRAASAAEEQDWVIHLQAGGACSSWEVCRDRWCSYQSPYDAAKMSTRFTPEVANGSGLFARNPSNAFGRANQVYVYYCSSDGWMGRRGDVVLDDPAGVGPSYRVHFRGFDIAQAVVEELERGAVSDDGAESLPLLDDANRVLLSGSSAGAQGVTQLLDWFRAQVPNAQVAGMMDAITDPLPEDVADPTVRERWQLGIETRHAVLSELYHPFHDESCLAAHSADEAYLCGFFTHVRLEHITTPFFVRQDLRDPVQFGYYQETGAALGDFATAVHLTMTRFPAILSTAEEKDDMLRAPGVHVSNCAQHIVMLNNPWFGVAQANNHTVEDAAAAPTTVHDALGAWVAGSAVEAIDTQPSSIAVCPSTTNDQ